MNFFEQQLRNIFNGSEHSNDIKYIGRSCYITLDEATKVKATFISTLISNQYDALRLEVLNRNDGAVDKLTLRFADYFTRSANRNNCPHLWESDGKACWYGTPFGSELSALSSAANEYVGVFAPESEQTQNEEMEME